MTALVAGRDTKQIAGPIASDVLVAESHPIAAATSIFAGGLVGLDASANAGPASATFNRVRGRAESTKLNTVAAGYGAAGDLRIEALPGVFDFVNGDSIVAADIGKPCYLGDDNVVFKAASVTGTAKPFAGIIMGLDGTQVKVGVGVPFNGLPFGTPQPLGTLAAFAAAAIAPAAADLTHDAVYDVPTTAANSTITLPAASPIGTRVTFCADGTKNGHTVQYVDATGTVNLTTALTASKRHQVTCIKISATIWTAAAYIGP